MAKMRVSDVAVATVLPFTERGEIDWSSYRRLLDYCATPDGISAVFVNGHAGECATLSPREQVEVIEFARRVIDPSKLLFAGIVAMATREAIARAKDARAAGAEVAVLFPPPSIAAGGARNAEVPLAFVTEVMEAVDMKLSIFQYPLASGCGYTTETLVEMARLPAVIAIKEGSDTIMAYEETWRQVKAAAPDVAILPSNFDWFLAQLAIGADGILSGLASLAPHFLVDLWRATTRADLPGMRAASDRLYPIVRSIYGAPPRMDMHTRIKVALRHLGIIDCASPRGPLLPLAKDTEARIIATVEGAGLAHFAPCAPRRAAG
ncbi:MAG: dihydrodipicolinate synthase family protein [Pseudomonadota bacterium]